MSTQMIQKLNENEILEEYKDYSTTEERREEIIEQILKNNLTYDYFLLLSKLIKAYSTLADDKIKIFNKMLKDAENDYSLLTKIYKLYIDDGSSSYHSNDSYHSYVKLNIKITDSLFRHSKEDNTLFKLLSFLLSNNNSLRMTISKNNASCIHKIFEEVLQSNNEFFKFYKFWFKEEFPGHLFSYGQTRELMECRKVSLWSSSKYKHNNIQEILLQNIKILDIVDTVLILAFEAQYILQKYTELEFEDFPECEEAINSLLKKYDGSMYQLSNFNKFMKVIKSLLKNNKIILALYILTNYGAWGSKGEAKLLVDAYVEAFVLLKRYDILTKYYNSLNIMSNNIEFLAQITQFFIANKDIEQAQEATERMKMLEPSYHYINEAEKEIKSMLLVNKMLSINIDIEHMNNLSGQEFEQLLIAKFVKLGYKTKDTPVSGDYGADIIVEADDDTRFIIQCKRFKSKVNLKAVQEVVGALAHFDGDIGIVITNSTFLNSAIKLASSNDCKFHSHLSTHFTLMFPPVS